MGVGSAYLGGRFVLGSGRTWPHDFRFLACFFSAPLIKSISAKESSCVSSDATDPSLIGVARSGKDDAASRFDSDNRVASGVAASIVSNVFGAEVDDVGNNEG